MCSKCLNGMCGLCYAVVFDYQNQAFNKCECTHAAV